MMQRYTSKIGTLEKIKWHFGFNHFYFIIVQTVRLCLSNAYLANFNKAWEYLRIGGSI